VLTAFSITFAGFASIDPLLAASLSGRVELVSPRSSRPPRGVNPSEVVVAFVSASNPSIEVPDLPISMATQRKAFAPELLIVPVGAEVVFPNFDPVLHNVFSITPDNAFDLGLYGRGEGKSAVFREPGVVRVFCNVHQKMFGHILVLDTPYYTRPDANGRFSLEDLPEGPGELLVWHPQAELMRQPAVAGRDSVVQLEIERRRVPAHLNKFGKPYRARRDRYNR